MQLRRVLKCVLIEILIDGWLPRQLCNFMSRGSCQVIWHHHELTFEPAERTIITYYKGRLCVRCYKVRQLRLLRSPTAFDYDKCYYKVQHGVREVLQDARLLQSATVHHIPSLRPSTQFIRSSIQSTYIPFLSSTAIIRKYVDVLRPCEMCYL